MVAPAEVPPRYYALADAFVSASTSEAQGLTYIEALAAGLPLLCRDDPCVRSLITRGRMAGSTTPPASWPPWSTPCRRAVRQGPLRRKARQAAAPYTRQAFGASVEALYRRPAAILDKPAVPRTARTRSVILW